MKIFTAIARWFSRSGVVEEVDSSLSRNHQMAMAEIERLLNGQSCLIKTVRNVADERHADILALLKPLALTVAELRKTHGELLQEVGAMHSRVNSANKMIVQGFDSAEVANVTMSKKLDVLMERPFFNLRELKGAIADVSKEQGDKKVSTVILNGETPRKLNSGEKRPCEARFDISPRSVDDYIKEREAATGKPFHTPRRKFAALVSRMAREQGVTLRYFREPVWRNLITAYPLSILAAANNKLAQELLRKK